VVPVTLAFVRLAFVARVPRTTTTLKKSRFGSSDF
jgi:hypothetical protein